MAPKGFSPAYAPPRSAIVITSRALCYAQERAWRDDHRRVDNGSAVPAVMGRAMRAQVSIDRCGWWQRGQN
jgi:hypothetical protein